MCVYNTELADICGAHSIGPAHQLHTTEKVRLSWWREWRRGGGGLIEVTARDEDKKKPFSYMGFGGGRHACIGQHFAYLQVC
jgi:hypothetical protein